MLHAQYTSTLSSGFPISQGNAEALDRWGGKTKHHMIPYFLGNISAKNYRNRFVYAKIIASQRWDVFWDAVYMTTNDFKQSYRSNTIVEFVAVSIVVINFLWWDACCVDVSAAKMKFIIPKAEKAWFYSYTVDKYRTKYNKDKLLVQQ